MWPILWARIATFLCCNYSRTEWVCAGLTCPMLVRPCLMATLLATPRPPTTFTPHALVKTGDWAAPGTGVYTAATLAVKMNAIAAFILPLKSTFARLCLQRPKLLLLFCRVHIMHTRRQECYGELLCCVSKQNPCKLASQVSYQTSYFTGYIIIPSNLLGNDV